MAEDGLLPRLFLDHIFGTKVAGIGMILLVGFVPFQQLNDSISSGILIAFPMTKISLILSQCPKKNDDTIITLLSKRIQIRMLTTRIMIHPHPYDVD